MATTEKGIYYPNDGTKTADVLADLKQMAESVDETIGKEVEENKYNDADIKKDISDIKKEQATQNANIENLQENDTNQDELISKLKSALINVETEESKSLHIEDASEVPAQLKVLGNQEQETREGYNLLENTAVTQTINGITFTVNDNGTVTVNGTATAQAVLKINQTLILENGNYKLNGCPEEGSSSTYRFRLFRTNTNAVPDIGSGAFFEITENIKFNYLDIAIEEGTKISNLVFKPMIVKGTEEKLYEPYGAMPSPDYPSTVICLGSNKNLFDKDNVNLISLNATNQENGTFSAATNQKHIYIECKPLTTYTITKSILADTTLGIYETGEIPAVNVNYHQLYLKAASTGIATVKTGENAKYLDIRLNSRALTEEELQEILDTLKIEEGTKATSYSPYGQGSTKISKINKNLFDNEFEAGIIDSDGTERTSSSTKNIRTKSYTRVFEGHNYTIINGIKNNLLKGRLYDINKKFIGTSSQITSNTDDLIKTYTAKEGVAFIRFQLDFDDAETGQAVIDGQYPFAIYQDSDDTEYVEHEQTDNILNIQQEMLSGDYFELEEDGWKEVHGWIKVALDGVSNKVLAETTNTEGKYRYFHSISTIEIENCSKNATGKEAYCEQLKLLFDGQTYNCIEGFTVNNNSILIYTDGDTANNFNIKLQENNMVFYIPVVESARTKLPCTEEQSAVLDELNNLNLFDGVNNIITAENIAKIKLYYIANAKKYIDKETSDIKEQLNTINELLSTTATSSLLLDNLQSDLESEVM